MRLQLFTALGLVAAFDLETRQFDVKNAYLYAPLDETIFTECPEGFKVKGKAWRLKRALYGLRRAPYLWNKTFIEALKRGV